MNNHPIERKKVHPEVRKLNTLIVEVWERLKIVLVLNISKILCKQHGVIQILKKVLP